MQVPTYPIVAFFINCIININDKNKDKQLIEYDLFAIANIDGVCFCILYCLQLFYIVCVLCCGCKL